MKAVCSLIIAAVTSLAQFTAACPMCKDSIAAAKGALAGPGNGPTGGGTGGGSVASGFNWSVYLMLAAFLFALGLVAFNLARGIRSADRAVAPAK